MVMKTRLGLLPMYYKNKGTCVRIKINHCISKGTFKRITCTTSGEVFEVTNRSRMNFNSTYVTFFHTTHSIPDSLGVVFHTSEGAIVHTGEFKFDQSATGKFKPDLAKMAQLGEDGVFILLSESCEAERPGYTTSEIVIEEQLSKTFHSAPGRILVAVYASNFIRIQQVFAQAQKSFRKVVIVGKPLEKAVDLGVQLGYLTVQEDTIIPISEMQNIKMMKLSLLQQAIEENPRCFRKIVRKHHRDIKIKQGDTVLITFTPSPGMEVQMANTMNSMSKAGAEILTSSKNVHVSGHGSQEDLKLMLNLMQPKYFIPVQGEYRMLIAHSKLAQQLGMQKSQILSLIKGYRRI